MASMMANNDFAGSKKLDATGPALSQGPFSSVFHALKMAIVSMKHGLVSLRNKRAQRSQEKLMAFEIRRLQQVAPHMLRDIGLENGVRLPEPQSMPFRVSYMSIY